MPMDSRSKAERFLGRRRFLKGTSLGVLGVFLFSVVSGRLFSDTERGARQLPVFPDGSIFAPAEKYRTEI